MDIQLIMRGTSHRGLALHSRSMLAKPQGQSFKGVSPLVRQQDRPITPRVATSAADLGKVEGSTVPGEIAPAVLPGTPMDFPIKEDELIELAKKIYANGVGLNDPAELADDFRFEFPVVSLPKDEFIKAVSSFKLEKAFPNMQTRPYHFRVDPYEPNRVWFTTRMSATHTDALNFGGTAYPATGKEVYAAPECLSMVFNEKGQLTSFTGGYIMDRRVGNGGGYGAVFGILTALGVKIPAPGSLGFKIANWIAALRRKFSS